MGTLLFIFAITSKTVPVLASTKIQIVLVYHLTLL